MEEGREKEMRESGIGLKKIINKELKIYVAWYKTIVIKAINANND